MRGRVVSYSGAGCYLGYLSEADQMSYFLNTYELDEWYERMEDDAYADDLNDEDEESDND
jgi:hypothetical protein